MSAPLGAVLFAALALGGGCQRPTDPEGVTSAAIDGNVAFNELWDSTLSVLRKHDFQPDRQDRTERVIVCFPTTSMQWHEPWRQDVRDGYSLLEASTHTIQRRATVKFVQEPRWTVEVTVDVFRLSTPETQITSASSALHGFSGALPTAEGETHRMCSKQYGNRE